MRLEGLVSYSMPQGEQRGSEVDLSDRTYDGKDDGSYLIGGLGQLVDGQVGADNFRLDANGHGKGNSMCAFVCFCPNLIQLETYDLH